MRLLSYWLRRLTWSAAGFAAAFTLASYFLIPPADMLWWAQHRLSVADRLEIIRHYPRDSMELEKRVERANATVANCASEAQGLRSQNEAHAKRVKELETERDTLRITAARPPATCDVDPAALKGQRVAPNNSVEFFGGRLHLSVSNVYDESCRYSVGTDKYRAGSPSMQAVGNEETAYTSIGEFRVVLRRFSKASNDGAFCEFDVIPMRKN